MELITFVLCAYGLTQILVFSDLPLLKRARPSKESGRGYGKLFNCPMCMGFHVGWFLMLLSPFTELFNFDVTITNLFLTWLVIVWNILCFEHDIRRQGDTIFTNYGDNRQ
jgi:hypothetical protein